MISEKKIKTLALSWFFLSYITFAGDTSSSGVPGPSEQPKIMFEKNEAVLLLEADLKEKGYQDFTSTSAVVLSSSCDPNMDGYAGRCINIYLVSKELALVSSDAIDSKIITALVVLDSYDGVRGVTSQSSVRVLDESMVQTILNLGKK